MFLVYIFTSEQHVCKFVLTKIVLKQYVGYKCFFFTLIMVVNLPSAIIIKNNANIDICKTQCVAFALFKVHFYT
jgi:hypothetical protein